MEKNGIVYLDNQTSRCSSQSHLFLETGGFVKSNEMSDYPNIQFHFFPSLVLDHGRKSSTCHAFQAHVGPMRPTSRGSVKLKSNNPNEAPSIQFNYMQTEHVRFAYN